MVNLYATLIINKRRTFDQVPEKFKADVEAKLLEYGYDTNGDPIAEEGLTEIGRESALRWAPSPN